MACRTVLDGVLKAVNQVTDDDNPASASDQPKAKSSVKASMKGFQAFRNGPYNRGKHVPPVTRQPRTHKFKVCLLPGPLQKVGSHTLKKISHVYPLIGSQQNVDIMVTNSPVEPVLRSIYKEILPPSTAFTLGVVDSQRQTVPLPNTMSTGLDLYNLKKSGVNGKYKRSGIYLIPNQVLPGLSNDLANLLKDTVEEVAMDTDSVPSSSFPNDEQASQELEELSKLVIYLARQDLSTMYYCNKKNMVKQKTSAIHDDAMTWINAVLQHIAPLPVMLRETCLLAIIACIMACYLQKPSDFLNQIPSGVMRHIQAHVNPVPAVKDVRYKPVWLPLLVGVLWQKVTYNKVKAVQKSSDADSTNVCAECGIWHNMQTHWQCSTCLERTCLHCHCGLLQGAIDHPHTPMLDKETLSVHRINKEEIPQSYCIQCSKVILQLKQCVIADRYGTLQMDLHGIPSLYNNCYSCAVLSILQYLQPIRMLVKGSTRSSVVASLRDTFLSAQQLRNARKNMKSQRYSEYQAALMSLCSAMEWDTVKHRARGIGFFNDASEFLEELIRQLIASVKEEDTNMEETLRAIFTYKKVECVKVSQYNTELMANTEEGVIHNVHIAEGNKKLPNIIEASLQGSLVSTPQGEVETYFNIESGDVLLLLIVDRPLSKSTLEIQPVLPNAALSGFLDEGDMCLFNLFAAILWYPGHFKSCVLADKESKTWIVHDNDKAVKLLSEVEALKVLSTSGYVLFYIKAKSYDNLVEVQKLQVKTTRKSSNKIQECNLCPVCGRTNKNAEECKTLHSLHKAKDQNKCSVCGEVGYLAKDCGCRQRQGQSSLSENCTEIEAAYEFEAGIEQQGLVSTPVHIDKNSDGTVMKMILGFGEEVSATEDTLPVSSIEENGITTQVFLDIGAGAISDTATTLLATLQEDMPTSEQVGESETAFTPCSGDSKVGSAPTDKSKGEQEQDSEEIHVESTAKYVDSEPIDVESKAKDVASDTDTDMDADDTEEDKWLCKMPFEKQHQFLKHKIDTFKIVLQKPTMGRNEAHAGSSSSRGEMRPIESMDASAHSSQNDTDYVPYEEASRCVDQAFKDVVGQTALKQHIKDMCALLLDERHRLGNTRRFSHMVLEGPPGTGKTTCAMLIKDVLFALDLIPRDFMHKISAGAIIATYEGQTKEKTREAVTHAMGGVLFLDEAYSLIKRGKHGYGHEALDEIMYMMDDIHNPVMIFAGYEIEMEEFIKSNEGFRRRVKVLKILPYTDEELSEIMKVKLQAENAVLETDVNVLDVLENFSVDIKKRSNGGLIVRLIEVMNMLRVREVSYKKGQAIDMQVKFTKEQLEKAANVVSVDLHCNA